MERGTEMRRIALILIAIMASTCLAYGTTDKQLVRKYVKKHYPKYRIVYTTNPCPKHKSKDVVTVSVEKSFSDGGYYGTTLDGYTIAYNKKVKKGKKVKSYLIWNPHNNTCDDVVAVVDNKKIRW